jgi:hypothetical protein
MIKQLKHRIEASTEEREDLMEELFEKRVELNYVLVSFFGSYNRLSWLKVFTINQHYPRLEKYISLYPSDKVSESEEIKGKPKDGSSRTDQRREELKSEVREAMRNGEVSNEPELESHESGKGTTTSSSVQDTSRSESIKGRRKSRHKLPVGDSDKRHNAILENDEFFGVDWESEMIDFRKFYQ